ELGGVEGNFGDKPLWELALELGQFLAHFGRHVERVRARRLIDCQPCRRLPVEREDLPVSLRSRFDPTHVAEPRDLPSAAGLDNHLGEFGPCACTACSSCDSALDTRFCTRTCAVSRSTPILNVTVNE